MLMSLMSQHPEIGVTSRAVSHGLYDPKGFTPDYSIFDSSQEHPVYKEALKRGKKIVLLKEDKGDDKNRGTPQVNECNFNVFPNDEALKRAKPFFLFRDPVRTFDSWKEKGWTDIDSFIESYKSTFKEYKRAKELSPESFCLTYELLTKDPETSRRVVKKICQHLGVEFHDDMMKLPKDLSESFIFMNESERGIYQQNAKGLFTTLIASKDKGIDHQVKPHGLVTDEEKKRINNELMPIYQEIQKDVNRLFPEKGQASGRG